MNNKHIPLTLLIVAVALSGVIACAGRGNDPLKNTRKLVREGHATLYNNGAFHVPRSSIYLIPPAPGATDFAMELMGLRARQAFLTSLKKASESVYIVSAGSVMSFKAAEKEREVGHDIADYIRSRSRQGSVLLMSRSSAAGQNIIGNSWTFSKNILSEMSELGENVTRETSRIAGTMDQKGSSAGKDTISQSIEFSKTYADNRRKGAQRSRHHALDAFVDGYLAVPEKMKQNLTAAGDHLDDADFQDIVEEKNEFREKWSGKSVDLIGSTLGAYTDDVNSSLSKAGTEFGGWKTTGIPLASLKAMRWVVKGLFWDATIEPAAKITSGGLGYVAVNCLAFPVMVIEKEGRALTRIAVDVTWNTSKSAYELVAPTAEASLAGAYSVLEYTSGPIVAGTAAAGGTLIGAAEIGASKAGSLIVKSGGAAAGKATQYVGVPLTAAGIAVSGATVGAAVMGAGAAGSGTVLLAGETSAGASDLFGNLLAGGTLVSGAAVSVAAGSSYGIYQLSKAVAVPSGYELGGGVVLSYETLSQISAQAILSVSDCAYLVLSLEGPRWVVYAVKGNLGKGEDLVPGTVMDLNKMKSQGEEIYNVPLSDEEMKNVVKSTSRDLPVLAPPQDK